MTPALARSYRLCDEIAKREAGNFYPAFLLLPAPKRRSMCALYTFMRIADDLYLSTSPDLLRQLLGPAPPPRTRLILGYSGWGPGQLEYELEASAWLMTDVDSDLIFRTPPEQMWEAAIRRLGADPATLQMSRGVH